MVIALSLDDSEHPLLPQTSPPHQPPQPSQWPMMFRVVLTLLNLHAIAFVASISLIICVFSTDAWHVFKLWEKVVWYIVWIVIAGLICALASWGLKLFVRAAGWWAPVLITVEMGGWWVLWMLGKV
jgi:hypothetical protein